MMEVTSGSVSCIIFPQARAFPSTLDSQLGSPVEPVGVYKDLLLTRELGSLFLISVLILNASNDCDLYEVEFVCKKTLPEKLGTAVEKALSYCLG